MNNFPSQQDRKGKGRAPTTPPPSPKRAKTPPTTSGPASSSQPEPKSEPEFDLEGAFHEEFGAADVEPPKDQVILNRPKRVPRLSRVAKAGSSSAAVQPVATPQAAAQPAASEGAGPSASVMAEPVPTFNGFAAVEKSADILSAAVVEGKATPHEGPAGNPGKAPSAEEPLSGIAASFSEKELALAMVLANLKAMVEPGAPASSSVATTAAEAAEPLPSPFLRPSEGVDVGGSVGIPAVAQPAKPAPAVGETAPQMSSETDIPVIALQDVSPQGPTLAQPVFPTAVVPTDKDEGDLPDAPPCAIIHVAVDREIDIPDAPIDPCDHDEDVRMSDAPVLRAYGGRCLPLSRKHVQFLKKMRTLQARSKSERQRRMTINLWGTGLFPQFCRNFTDPQVKIDRGGIYLVGRSVCKWPRLS
ncbi:hypothetical protein AOL_s00007g213 [Orbilia oligospora ATCC 24927]|uniref:Uncharacterized protein n=1 Tax=Arthrobotrys oligospora (strain ATCC 24927 / CBS 115.81 / DSM 1491) TaxID=756982 RepID=G1X1Q4_ARTOA|nr:hypothetical protein AOL_s00007g213 [Orbilia oligospora ATCC 24927]EGX52877.1 hypothetical protein AOL_s00007g213 [Orbilia oligospora ATCC 24927]